MTTMRFLCLHGRGTNSDIFESQLAPLISRVPKSYEFDFIDAEIPAKPAPGVAAHHPGPFFAWIRGLASADEIAATVDTINTVIEEDGPYDAIIGFSEGAALAATVLLSPPPGTNREPGFKFAVFICGALPFCLSTETGVDSTDYVLEYVKNSLDFFGLEQADVDAWPSSKRIHTYKPLSDTMEQSGDLNIPKIDIPTLHVLGANDPFLGFGLHLASLCDRKKSCIVTSQCGHELPRSDATRDMVASHFEGLLEMAQLDL